MAWESSSSQTGRGEAETVASGGQNPDSGIPSVSPASAGSGQTKAQAARRPEFTFEFKVRHHSISVDVFSIRDGEFALFYGWGGRWRRLPVALAAKIVRSADVQERAFDAERDYYHSQKLHAAGL